MNAVDRQRIREAIDKHKRQEREHIVATARGQGRCSGCGERSEDFNPACERGKDRRRFRASRRGRRA